MHNICTGTGAYMLQCVHRCNMQCNAPVRFEQKCTVRKNLHLSSYFQLYRPYVKTSSINSRGCSRGFFESSIEFCNTKNLRQNVFSLQCLHPWIYSYRQLCGAKGMTLYSCFSQGHHTLLQEITFQVPPPMMRDPYQLTITSLTLQSHHHEPLRVPPHQRGGANVNAHQLWPPPDHNAIFNLPQSLLVPLPQVVQVPHIHPQANYINYQ